MSHPHLTPDPTSAPDPVFAAAVAHASTIAETRDPLAAMRSAFRAAGVVLLEERVDELLETVADLQARNAAAADALRTQAHGCDAASAPIAATAGRPHPR